MWIVRLALKRPYTFFVLAILLLLLGPLAAFRTPTDIFPSIDIPVVAVVWQYKGLPAEQMAGRVVSPFARSLTTTVNDVEHVETRSVQGYGIVKIFFQPNVDIAVANAQVTAISQTKLSELPPGTNPPLILNYDASTVSILQLALSAEGLSEQQLSDLGLNKIRPQLATVAGAAVPYPYGGKLREIRVALNPDALRRYELSAADVSAALQRQNQITPVGVQKVGGFEYTLQLNNAPSEIAELNDLPVAQRKGTVIRMRDVGQVLDGSPPQTNIVHVDGERSVLLRVLKNGSASTLAIVSGVKENAEQLEGESAEGLGIEPFADQSIFVRAALFSVAREGTIAAVLTGLMTLLFLGSWRSTSIIAMSIPLSILGSLLTLAVIGETLNIMTLGGLALAVGILVDDATVTIENINAHLESGQDVQEAILEGAGEIALPVLVSVLCICVAFVPMFFLEGVPGYLFVPLAEAVIFAMLWSYVLSRTFVPTMAKYILRKPKTEAEAEQSSKNVLQRFQSAFLRRFDRAREAHRQRLAKILKRPKLAMLIFAGVIGGSLALFPALGERFFPEVDTGQITLHIRAPVGTRVEETAHLFAHVEAEIRRIIPTDELNTIVDNIGLSNSGINTAYNNTGTIGGQDGDIQISLAEDHGPTADYVRELRTQLPRLFPQATFSFPPADIVSQILNFGAPAPVIVQLQGTKLDENFDLAESMLGELKRVPGIADVRIQQSRDYPTFDISVNRQQAQLLGVSMKAISDTLRVTFSGSSQVNPTFWLNPENGVSYPITVQVPQYQVDQLDALRSVPVRAEDGTVHLLGSLARFERKTTSAVYDQYDIKPVVQIYADIEDRDLGGVADGVRAVVDRYRDKLPAGTSLTIKGQVQTMDDAFFGLFVGLLGSLALIYLLIVVNFQSWTDPFVIICAIPAALVGIIWALFLTGTDLSVPALTGAIMCMGVATNDSILVVAAARAKLDGSPNSGSSPVDAAIEAGASRFRPVLMTSISLVVGMLPLSLGLGEGGEQFAPLGRAVIGGVIFSTVATLLLVPIIFAALHASPSTTTHPAQATP